MAEAARKLEEAAAPVEKISGGHLVAKALKAEGVKVIFTLCGGHIIDIYDGCLDEDIKIIDVRHEQVAAHAAHRLNHQRGHGRHEHDVIEFLRQFVLRRIVGLQRELVLGASGSANLRSTASRSSLRSPAKTVTFGTPWHRSRMTCIVPIGPAAPTMLILSFGRISAVAGIAGQRVRHIVAGRADDADAAVMNAANWRYDRHGRTCRRLGRCRTSPRMPTLGNSAATVSALAPK